MKLKYEKTVRIMNDLLGYCHFLGAQTLHTDIRLIPGESLIRIVAEVENLDEKTVQEVERLLNMPRQREMEQQYWNISGEEEIDGELLLAGIMVDEATVTYDGATLTIQALRKDL